MKEDYLQVGVITSPHGVHGEVKVYPTTDDPARFKTLKEAILETRKGQVVVHPNRVKFFKNMVILGFEEFDSMNDVEQLRQCPIRVTRENAVKLKKDEYFVADLIGIEVIDEEAGLKGTLSDVIETGANDVYEIKLEDGRELLLPAIRECIMDVDMDARVMKVHILDGLL
ncbi:MAG: ribosome maturation factor RimM [Lachnospiraceae bacterium]|nr:ribosome maturation factor RimM [Lachnospiraceae bacterium]